MREGKSRDLRRASGQLLSDLECPGFPDHHPPAKIGRGQQSYGHVSKSGRWRRARSAPAGETRARKPRPRPEPGMSAEGDQTTPRTGLAGSRGRSAPRGHSPGTAARPARERCPRSQSLTSPGPAISIEVRHERSRWSSGWSLKPVTAPACPRTRARSRLAAMSQKTRFPSCLPSRGDVHRHSSPGSRSAPRGARAAKNRAGTWSRGKTIRSPADRAHPGREPGWRGSPGRIRDDPRPSLPGPGGSACRTRAGGLPARGPRPGRGPRHSSRLCRSRKA